MWDASVIVPLLTALGVGAILSKAVEYALNRLGGRYERISQVWRRVDIESRKRRQLEDDLHRVRLIARELGATSDQLGDWPVYEDEK